jgi:surface polysaccharide O-acyltransferase-like enzyme
VAGVPAFLFVSGYFIAFASGRGTKPVSWQMVFNRVRDLLIPYLIWCTAYLALDFAEGKPFSPLEALRLVATGQLAPPFYYVVLLVQLYLLSPLLVPLMRRFWKLALVGAALIQIPGVVINHLLQIDANTPMPALARLLFEWDVPTFIFWFLLGITVGINLTAFKAFLERNRAWLLPAAIIAAGLGMWEWEWLRQVSGREWLSPQEMFFSRLFALFAILGYFSLPDLEKRLPAWLATVGAKSFGIYLIHSLVLEIIARVTYHVAPALFGYPIFFLVLLTAAGLLLPFGMILILERSTAKRYVKLLTGG